MEFMSQERELISQVMIQDAMSILIPGANMEYPSDTVSPVEIGISNNSRSQE
jgi:hypothetical protein